MTCGLESLKCKSQQTIEGSLVTAHRFGQTLADGLLEWFKVLIVVAVETFFAHKAPQAFNQIERGEYGGRNSSSMPSCLACSSMS